jgi:NTE family protein
MPGPDELLANNWPTAPSTSTPIAIALSGGGVRAMAFHAGVLKYLAEQAALERVKRISTVSGGSLLMGLLFRHADYAWPASSGYLDTVYPRLRHTLTTMDLQQAAKRELVRVRNWRFLLSRANTLATAIAETWDIRPCLEQLPSSPEWSINATTAETGKRACFKNAVFSDWSLGSVTLPAFPLSCALAVSAAFPGAIGPFVLETGGLAWRSAPFQKRADPTADKRFERIHLYDGGVYDNLGLEPFFDAGYVNLKRGLKDSSVLVADAGAPLLGGFNLGRLNPWRLKRVSDIMSEQVRSLRARGFAAYARSGPGRGAYLRMGKSASTVMQEFQGDPPAGDWLAEKDVLRAAQVPTTLGRLSVDTFDLLARHGWESAAIGQHVFRAL